MNIVLHYCRDNLGRYWLVCTIECRIMFPPTLSGSPPPGSGILYRSAWVLSRDGNSGPEDLVSGPRQLDPAGSRRGPDTRRGLDSDVNAKTKF